MVDRQDLRMRLGINAATAAAIRAAGYTDDARKIEQCSRNWAVDRYDLSQLLDVISVDRCHHRLCAVCARIRALKAMHRVAAAVAAAATQHPNWHWYHLTLTTRSRSDLKPMLDKLCKAWDTLYRQGHDNRNNARLIDIRGAVRSIEITYTKAGYHPHIHALICSETPPDDERIPTYNGVYHTHTEIQIGEWLARYVGDDTPHCEVMLQPVTTLAEAVPEICKYMAKPAEIAAYPASVIADILQNTIGRRMIQGRGALYHMPADDAPITSDMIDAMRRLLAAAALNMPISDVMSVSDLLSVYHNWHTIAIPKPLKATIRAMIAAERPADQLQQIITLLSSIDNRLASVQNAVLTTSSAHGG